MRSQQRRATNFFTKFIVACISYSLAILARLEFSQIAIKRWIESNLPWLVLLGAVGDGLWYAIN